MSNASTRRMIEQRRKQESAYRDMDYIVAADKKQHLITTFEISTCAKIDRKKAEVDALLCF